jgi:hypothetical protein
MKINKKIEKELLKRYECYEEPKLICYNSIAYPDITVHIVRVRDWDNGDDVYMYRGSVEYDGGDSANYATGITLQECKRKLKSSLKEHIDYYVKAYTKIGKKL